jgi:hypothetical protein
MGVGKIKPRGGIKGGDENAQIEYLSHRLAIYRISVMSFGVVQRLCLFGALNLFSATADNVFGL